MHSTLPFLLALSFIILLAKAAGYASVRLRQPAVLGELSEPRTGILFVLPLSRVVGFRPGDRDTKKGKAG